MREFSLKQFLIYLGLFLFLSTFSLAFALTSYFEVKDSYFSNLIYLLSFLFENLTVTLIFCSSLILGLILTFLIYYFLEGDFKNKDHIRGSQIINSSLLSKKTLKASCRENKQITIASVPIPNNLENLHFLIGGRTGTGKTVAIKEMLSGILSRGDRVIVMDPNGDYLSHFFESGDLILNPFDNRSEAWSIFNELHSVYDHERFAKSVIPPARSSHDSEWHSYAQLLFSETTKKLFSEGIYSSEVLRDWLTIKPVEDLALFLSGTAASALFDPGASKALASTRFIIANYIAAHQYLSEGIFSLKDWLANPKSGNLFITWREDMAEALRPLISTWLDILFTSILSSESQKKGNQKIWAIIDELASLERLNSLEAALTKGRKHGLRIVTGLQSTAQLDFLYGREKAIVLRSCFSNLLILGGTSSDAQTAEDFSRGLGERDIERVQKSKTRSRRGSQQSEVKQRIKERIVLPSEITNLPTLHGYLSLAGDYPVALVKLKVKNYPKRIEAFEE